MAYLLNLLYLAVLALVSPWLCFKALTTGKYRRGLAAKLLGRVAHSQLVDDGKPVAWFHGVSVGEIHLLRSLVARFRERFPGWRCVISTTTDTGHDEARKSFPDLAVIDWPFDFTWAVTAALQRVRPSLVVLAEGEVWPNFVWAAKRQGVRLAIVNGRMSPRSAARYGKLRILVRSIFGRIDLIAAQTDEYRDHFAAMGAPHVVTTRNVKYDGVQTDRDNPKTQAMAELLGIRPGGIFWVAGSTQEPEERLCTEIYAKARRLHPRLRLIVVPRHRERFDEVASLLEGSGLPFVRRSRLGSPPHPQPLSPGGERGDLNGVPADAVILGDSMGELSAIWGLSDIAFVGGSLDGKRGGQNMIEPAAYGAAVLFGPHTWNFKDTVANLLRRHAAVEVADGAAIEAEILRLLAEPERRQRLGRAAQEFVASQQGATERTLDLLARLMAADTASLPPEMAHAYDFHGAAIKQQRPTR
jgi:3-deoxy-D-manno-octulosonic-acid transferase